MMSAFTDDGSMLYLLIILVDVSTFICLFLGKFKRYRDV